MKEECLLCGAPLEYLEQGTEMECAMCHKKEISRARCMKGHYVCDSCHTAGVDSIVGICLQEQRKNPYTILSRLMDLPFCHMHGPEHHIMVGSSLLTAYHNAGGKLDLEKALYEMQERGRQVPGGICGFWGSCGAAISSGIFLSIVLGATPLSGREWGLCNQLTSAVLADIGAVGGPRCCKRNSYLSLKRAVPFVKEHLGVEMELSEIRCRHRGQNAQCIGTRCPFFPK
ncbi:MAG: SAM-dependent methyltransferase [Ruminococcaceae bacterium]|nr:SAM-dependent methyltransferase [Oscillospiraceae bacterium]